MSSSLRVSLATQLSRAWLLACIIFVLCGCPNANQNPKRLWLALDGVETKVTLVPQEPEPY
jgi:hypothetical protein